MNRLFFLLSIITILSFQSCNQQNIQSLSSNSLSSASLSSDSKTSHTYDEVKNKHIYWSNIFTRSEDTYLVYIYSTTCSHCNAIKNDVIEYSLESTVPMYFIVSSPEILIDQKIALNQNVTSLDDLAIRGYPSLLYLVDHTVMINIAGERGILDTLETLSNH